MSYEQTRDDEQLKHADDAIDEFIVRYNNQVVSAAGRQTIILFPGGMGSKLKRASKPYVDAVTGPQSFDYTEIWLNAGTLVLRWSFLLQMHKDAAGVYRDFDDHIIIADGVIGMLGADPYDEFIDWCDEKALDWYIFSWDWRRPVGDAAKFFVNRFLPHFQQRVMAECGGADPLSKFSLIGHSAGGMVVNAVLRSNAAIVTAMDKAITAGTPFYGYGGQMHRWFEGERYLNGFLNVHKKRIKRVIASLPGCYEYLFMTANTYTANNAALGADPNYPLGAYPCVDESTYLAADPYNPLPNPTSPTKVRYPPPNITGFDPAALEAGERVMEALATKLPPTLEAKFFNLRGVRDQIDTAGDVTWDWVFPGKFDQEPIKDVTSVHGDDTQPAWTTRLVTQPASHCIPVVGDVNHMFLMDCPETLAELGTLLNV